MDHLERQYLIAAYYSAMKDPFRTFQNHNLANDLDLGTSVADRVNRAAGIAEDLISMEASSKTLGRPPEVLVARMGRSHVSRVVVAV